MSKGVVIVALVVAEDAAPDALISTSTVLDDFGVAWERVEAKDCEGFGLDTATPWRAVIVASPDAHLPSALTIVSKLPVIRVPSSDGRIANLDLLYDADSNLPGPTGQETFATMAIGEAGAKNAALFVVAMLALTDNRLRDAWTEFRTRQTQAVLDQPPLV